jgi:hypothetical protein
MEEPARRQFETLMLQHVQAIAERMGGTERAISEMQSVQKDQSVSIGKIVLSVDRLEQAVGVNGNGLIETVKRQGKRIDDIEDRNLVSDTARKTRASFMTRPIGLVFTVIGTLVGWTLIQAAAKVIGKLFGGT